MGAKNWKFDPDPCESKQVGVVPQLPVTYTENIVECNCNIGNDSVCHIWRIVIKGFSLSGVLPPELVKLPYIQAVDFALNYLSGTIPAEWGTAPLTSISVLVNRLSGEIPKVLGRMTNLTYLNLEGNQFSGTIPSELGKLINLQALILSSNLLVGKLPDTFSGLVNLRDFRINDNNLSGPIPDFIQNWKQLQKLELIGTGLEGPIPSNISVLDNLADLRISDLKGPSQKFPPLSNMGSLNITVLRNCNISDEIPPYIWEFKSLLTLDLSFNNLVGELPNDVSARNGLKFVFLTGNKLSGDVPESILKPGINLDLSYNNFTWQGQDQPACKIGNRYVNLYKSSSKESSIWSVLPCLNQFSCPRYGCSLHVNSGGSDVAINEGNREVNYVGDAEVEGGSAKYYHSNSGNWGFSSTGDFLDDSNDQNARFIETVSSSGLSELYRNARVSPLSLTYFSYCLENGVYNVSLHFAEIIFTNNNTYFSLGRRFFDIYIQEKLVWKDFNIEDEARGVQKPLVRYFNATVSDNTLDIRLYWAGKGTTRIPARGHYGSLISAISVDPLFKTCKDDEGDGKRNIAIPVIVGLLVGFGIVIIVGLLWWKRYLFCRKGITTGLEGMELQMVSYTLKQIKAATNNFDIANKLGEGGFGPVYKGRLADGTLIAVKQLSSKSTQGNREFLNEIGMISCLQHPNLVKLYGCCIEGDQLLVVYEYMENNSLASALFGYMAPEYALWGYLTYKADVYSFGVVLLEVISGKNNNNYMPSHNCICLLDWACHLQLSGNLEELIDPKMDGLINEKEAEMIVKVGLLCTSASPSLRPTMSEVVGMLEGKIAIPDEIPEASTYTDDLRFKAMKDFHREKLKQMSTGSQTQYSTTVQTGLPRGALPSHNSTVLRPSWYSLSD
nr:probable LRR receptor-like serine/threonine-protein kinase RFK1 isoform X1 [Ipomoea batatas]